MARTSPNPPLPPTTATRWPAPLAFLLLFGLAFIAYLPALRGGFLWDDSAHVTRTDLRSLAGLFRIWLEIGATQQYYPFLHSTFWLEHRLWDDAVLGYHLINLLQHATAAFLFGLLLRRLAVPGAWFAAVLFALHPVGVESVAWISEQKNTLSTVLYLAAALAYLRFADARRPSAYTLASGFFALALLTKTVTASLPAALLVIAWWRHGRLEWRRDIMPLLPWFAAGAGMGLLTAHFEREFIGAQGADFALDFLQRGLLAGRVVWFYLGKLLWPANLRLIYPRWTVDATVWWQWLFPLAACVLFVALAWWTRRSRAPLAAALLFGGTLFPVLGFFNVYPFLYSYVADHFQYLASLALFAFAGAGLTQLLAWLPTAARIGAFVALPATLGLLTFFQAGMYRDSETLYRTTIARNPACWMAHNNLAIVLVESSRAIDALPHYEAALRLRSPYPEAEHNYGLALNRLGRFTEALLRLERAVALKPDYAEAHNELGVALMGLNRTAEGHPEFETALRLRPDFGMAHRNLGLALASSGRVTEGLPHFERAAALLPGDSEVHMQLATAYLVLNRMTDAVASYEAALRLDPNSAVAHLQLSVALRKLDRFAAANEHYQIALSLDPSLARR